MGEFFNIIDNENVALIPDGEKELREDLNALISEYGDLGSMETLEVTIEEGDPDDIVQRREGIQEKKQIDKKIHDLEKQKLPEIYSDTIYTSSIDFETHHRQEQNFSCVIASTLNTLEALGVRPNSTTESEVAGIFGETGKTSFVDIDKARQFIKDYKNPEGHNEFSVKDIRTTTDLISTLREGGVAMLAKPGHEVLVSGVKIENGNIVFKVNDPQYTEVQEYDLNTIIDLIDPGPNSNTFSIKRQDDIDIELNGKNDGSLNIELN